MQAAFKNHITKPHILVADSAEQLGHPFDPIGNLQSEMVSTDEEFRGLEVTGFSPAYGEKQGILLHPGVMRRVGPWPGPLFLSP